MTGKFILWFRLMLSGFTISAAAIVLIPFAGAFGEKYQGIISNISAILFWLGLAAGCVMTYMLTGVRRVLRGRIPRLRMEHNRDLPGIAAFTKSAKHVALYSVFVLGLTVMICDAVSTTIPPMSEYLMFTVIAATYYSFLLHCVIDGKNYKIYKFLKKGDRHGSKK